MSAVSLPDRRLLVFELDRHAEPMRALLQKAREQALARERTGEDRARRHTGDRPNRQSVILNPQSPIPNPQSTIRNLQFPMPTVDHLIQRYCECARSTWNNYLRPATPTKPPSNATRKCALLFRAIVLDGIGMSDAVRDREDETWPFLRVIAGAELSSILVNTPASDGNQY